MVMKAEELWHCTNPNCHCEILVKTAAEISGDNPRCTCGGIMKKQYVRPFASYLEFLRPEESPPVTSSSRKD